MALSGETIDYGPCAFMDAYDPDTVFSSIDRRRPLRLRQPAGDRAVEPGPVRRGPAAAARSRPGRRRSSVPRRPSTTSRPCSSSTGWPGCEPSWGCSREEAGDNELVDDLLDWMQRRSADFTNTFRELIDAASSRRRRQLPIPSSRPGIAGWQARRARQPQPRAEAEALMRRHNPAVIPRNHKVEEALQAATTADDLSVLDGCSACWRHRTITGATCQCSVRPADEPPLPHVLRHVRNRARASRVRATTRTFQRVAQPL